MAAGQKALLLCLFLMCAASLLSANPFLSLICVLAFGWLWFGALKSPLLTVMAAYLTFQWLQVSGAVWMANYYGADLTIPQSVDLRPTNIVYQVRQTTVEAILLGLAAISLMSLGFRLVPGSSRKIRRLDVSYHGPALLAAYCVLLVVHLVAGPLVGGGLAQPLMLLGKLRLMFAALLLYRWVLTRSGFGLVASVVLIELIVGFSGFFSGFKEIFFVMAVALLTLAPVEWKRVRPLIVGCVAITLLLGGAWTAVKGDYRAVLNQGKATQEVTIGVGERWEALQSLVADTGKSDLETSFVRMASRISYTDFLAVTMNRIPKIQPHADGAVWGAAIENALVPRFLFPDKAALPSASELTMRYTGLHLASAKQGASISIGYVGDSYIDFGVAGACLIVLLMGLVYGGAAAYVAGRFGERDTFAAVGSVIVLLSPVAAFETSIVGLFAGFLWTIIVVGGFAAFFWPSIRPLLAERPRRRSVPATRAVPVGERAN